MVANAGFESKSVALVHLKIYITNYMEEICFYHTA